MGYLVGPQPTPASRTPALPDLGSSLVQSSAGTPGSIQSPATDQNSDPISTLVQMRQQLASSPQQQANLAGAGLLNNATDYGQNNYNPGSGGGGGGYTPNGGVTGKFVGYGTPSGNVAQWITQAEQATGVNPSQWTNALNLIIQHESGGNPNAINNWDSNAKAGHPSQGLMQTIPSTFSAYVPKGMAGAPITDPVANIAAGIQYILSRYGGINNVPGVVAVSQGRPYVGY